MGRVKKTTARAGQPAKKGGVHLYSLEVFLIGGQITEKFAKKNPVVSRMIQIRGDQTLRDLHDAIFDAFDRAKKPNTMHWEFDSDIPTDDFFEGRPLSRSLELARSGRQFRLHVGTQGLSDLGGDHLRESRPAAHRRAGGGARNALISFNDTPDDRILYINEFARPSEPWHVILNQLAPYLLIEPFRTFDSHEDVTDGWPRITTALQDHGQRPVVAPRRGVVRGGRLCRLAAQALAATVL